MGRNDLIGMEKVHLVPKNNGFRKYGVSPHNKFLTKHTDIPKN